MPQLRIATLATCDLENVSRSLNLLSPRASQRLRKRFQKVFELLARNPLMGELREDFAPEVRIITVDDYVIFFTPMDDGVEILQVCHGSRDLEMAFRRFT